MRRSIVVAAEARGANRSSEVLSDEQTKPAAARAGATAGTKRDEELARISQLSELCLVPIFMSQLRIQGILVGHRRSFEAMVAAFEESQVKPVVDRVLPFDQAPGALQELAGGQHFGKICLSLQDAPT